MSLREVALRARRAGQALAQTSPDERAALLRDIAKVLLEPAATARIAAANATDVADVHSARERGELAPALVARIPLDAEKLAALAEGLQQLSEQTSLMGRTTLHRELDRGLVLRQVTAPFGLLGAVFEARPDAVVQITGLALCSGNAVLLKGGREARHTNRVLVEVLCEAIERRGLPAGIVTHLEDRAEVDAMLELDGVVDLIIARGSNRFVSSIMGRSRIPVLGHAEGLCHLYLHHSADPAMAARLAVDAKCTYPAACNSIETLLWDVGAEAALDASIAALLEAGVELRGCDASRARHPFMQPATEDDWHTEYGALVLAVRQVTGIDAALAHIEQFGSKHTEANVASDSSAAARFTASVDAAGVFHNASTRFADGFRYGLGAEVGVSTAKLHARGPVGVAGLLTYRWLLEGEGHVTSEYGVGKRTFTHRDLPTE